MSSGIGTIIINGRTITMVNSGPLIKPDGSPVSEWYYKNPTGPEQISVSSEVWEFLVENGLHKDVISLHVYKGLTTLEYLAVYVVLENISQGQSDALLELFEKPKEEADLQAFVEKGELTQSEVDFMIRRCRLDEAAEAIKKWKRSRIDTQRASLPYRSGAIFKQICQTLKGSNPIEKSVFSTTENRRRRVDFFKAIERTLKTGEKVFN